VPTKPSRGARERRLDDKRRRSQTKQNRRYTGGELPPSITGWVLTRPARG
jgi:hypothetical protein